jgi:hypothetical protein
MQTLTLPSAPAQANLCRSDSLARSRLRNMGAVLTSNSSSSASRWTNARSWKALHVAANLAGLETSQRPLLQLEEIPRLTPLPIPSRDENCARTTLRVIVFGWGAYESEWWTLINLVSVGDRDSHSQGNSFYIPVTANTARRLRCRRPTFLCPSQSSSRQ